MSRLSLGRGHPLVEGGESAMSPGRRPESEQFWSVRPDELARRLESSVEGLNSTEARRRLAMYGPNRLQTARRTDVLALLLSQFKSPIVLILIFAAVLSAFVGETIDSGIILVIIMVSALLGFWQERGAADAVAKLLAIVRTTANVLRDGKPTEVPVESVVPGDVVILDAGDSIPGDCLLIESNDLFVDEAALTGETYPVEKQPGPTPADSPLSGRTGALFMGTHVVSGEARALVVRTGQTTEFGHISERLRTSSPETEFERGVRRFGYLLMEVTLLLVVAIFAVNVYLQKPVLDSFLFSLALAVGLTPQLLPAIISVNLAQGAKRMAERQVVVRKLTSIENLGSMDLLCSDKTGTLTEGVAKVHSARDVDGNESEDVLRLAYLNAAFESGFVNPLDEAIRRYRQFDVTGYKKLDEIPYDFSRKRLSVLLRHDTRCLLITKGALTHVLDVCTRAQAGPSQDLSLSDVRSRIEQEYEQFSRDGFRVLGVAMRDLGDQCIIGRDDEHDLVFAGFLLIADPPKAGIAETVARLHRAGVALKVITGDNALVAAAVGRHLGLEAPRILTGPQMLQMSHAGLTRRVNDFDIFAEVEPNRKEDIILALKQSGKVVGYLGDGINDAPALHAADVGISVNSAVDVAKEAAEIVLLEHDLGVLLAGVEEGRRTFANTLKYVFMATSANFGNMFSMAGTSLFLPFLPLLPKQVLLVNLLSDLPEMTIATDEVDEDLVARPRRWDLRFIRRFMLVFGTLSSVFDYTTFGVLLFVLRATPAQFHAGWFVECVVSASMIVLVIRTRRPFFRSRPSRALALATLGVAVCTVLIPYSPLASMLDFEALPAEFLVALACILAAYVGAAEVTKRLFYGNVVARRQPRTAAIPGSPANPLI